MYETCEELLANVERDYPELLAPHHARPLAVSGAAAGLRCQCGGRAGVIGPLKSF